ncbi:MAG TPA: hypothetical protein VH120_14005, partial [Gemmataceae bacterium]|nr:hypothetical protein [Gemmataceae bacterium]
MRVMTLTAAVTVAVGLLALPGDTPAQIGRGGGRPAPQAARPAPSFSRPAAVPSFRPVTPTPRPAPNFARPAPIPTIRPNAPVARSAVPTTRAGGGMLNPGGVRPQAAGTAGPAPVVIGPSRTAPVPPTTRAGQPTTSFRPNVAPGSMPRPSQEQLGHWLNVPMQRNWPGANRGTSVNDRWERWNHPGNFNAFVQDRGNRVRAAAV